MKAKRVATGRWLGVFFIGENPSKLLSKVSETLRANPVGTVFGGIRLRQQLGIVSVFLFDDFRPAEFAMLVIPRGLTGANMKRPQTERDALEILPLVREPPVGLRNQSHEFLCRTAYYVAAGLLTYPNRRYGILRALACPALRGYH